ncbi:MAG: formimidoylglutamate deiminase, partial [Gammaproteobacteria bacterium]
QCAKAASDVGIGFTALPVLYQYGGFGSQAAGEGQKRFINDAEGFLEIVDSLRQGLQQDMRLGVAPHSLRAVDEQLLGTVLNAVEVDRVVHIHIAEQVKEVTDCVEWSGQRPVEWLYEHFSPTEKWCLIHATHMDHAETETVARSRAVVGLCPTTEANLGDGFFNGPEFWVRNGRWGIGSDSQISVSPIEELRWLEYGQRLVTKSRNVLAGDTLDDLHTGTALYRQGTLGGAAACSIKAGALALGNRADFLLIDDASPRLTGRSEGDLLDSMIFSGNENPVTGVYVGGKPVIVDQQHHDQVEIYAHYRQTINQLSN